MEIRPIRPDEWVDLRDLRMRALRGDPSAFSSTLDEDSTLDDDEWRRRASSDSHQVTLVAVAGRPVGMCAVVREGAADTARLVAMWVEPDHRSQGIGAALVEAAADWTSSHGIGTLHLWVNEGNTTAVGLYRDHGFVPTGDRRPLRPRSREWMIAMSRSLARQADPGDG